MIRLESRIFSSACLQIYWYFTSRKNLYECVCVCVCMLKRDAWETILSLPNIQTVTGQLY